MYEGQPGLSHIAGKRKAAATGSRTAARTRAGRNRGPAAAPWPGAGRTRPCPVQVKKTRRGGRLRDGARSGGQEGPSKFRVGGGCRGCRRPERGGGPVQGLPAPRGVRRRNVGAFPHTGETRPARIRIPPGPSAPFPGAAEQTRGGPPRWRRAATRAAKRTGRREGAGRVPAGNGRFHTEGGMPSGNHSSCYPVGSGWRETRPLVR